MAEMTTSDFDVWCVRLEAAHTAMRVDEGVEGYGADLFYVTGRDYWRQYFEEGEMPEAALYSDQQYWGPE